MGQEDSKREVGEGGYEQQWSRPVVATALRTFSCSYGYLHKVKAT